MRIVRVTAQHFGPLHGQTLEPAPGMTVVVGPNEAGKSSWHAAIRLALTGLRRSKGAPSREERQLTEQHRPWDQPEQWSVEARLELADGRLIEISQDLGAKVACRAIDVGLGRDVSDEIISDGAPDASRWLGLNRDAFAATAVVSQAQILSVANPETADMLQEHMQRAAATRGTDATAAEAIERIAEFRRSAVGLDRQNARGPLRSAVLALAEAEHDLARARAKHQDYLERRGAHQTASEAVGVAQRRLQVVEAHAARATADAIAGRLERARQLSVRHPSRPVPLQVQEEQTRAVASAIDGWQRRRPPVQLTGATAAAIEAELAALPTIPHGDRQPAPRVRDAMREVDRAEDALRQQQATPAAPSVQRPGWVPVAIGLATALALVGVVQLATGNAVLGGAALLLAAALGAAALTGARRPSRVPGAGDRLHAATERLAQAESELVEALQARDVEVDESDPRLALAAYLAACSERAAASEASARAGPLREALAARRAAEQSVEETRRAAQAAETALHQAAALIGAPESGRTSDELLETLRAWQAARDAALRQNEAAIAEWAELTGLLDGGTLADLEQEAARRRDTAQRLTEELGAPWPVDPTPGDETATALAVFRDDLERISLDAAEQAGRLQEMERGLPLVAEAEETAQAARAELERVRALGGVLDEAMRLLRGAEERVHRDLAPVLAAAVNRWLPAVSGGAYAEATVDPRDLAVRVKEARSGAWRQAALLSEGTREQIYLLLRAAMAEHLVTGGERAPLLLDEVTVQSDEARRRDLLGVLHELSTDRQVILFTHDEQVAAWAVANLAAPRDSLQRLPLGTFGPTVAVPVGIA